MTFHIITLFPKAFDSYLNESIIARARKNKLIKIKFYNPRDFTEDRRARVDRRPYGGGPGMVLEAPAIIKAVDAIHSQILKNLRMKRSRQRTPSLKRRVKVVIFSTSGRQFTNMYAKAAARKYTDLILVCGRYEGIDARVKKVFKAEELSVGPYILTGGELPAMILIDSVSRQIEGVLGNFDSLEENRVSASEVYTRPEVLTYKGKKYRVPKVLLTGHHRKIEEWKKNVAKQ